MNKKTIELCKDVLITAVESGGYGIGYWAGVKNYSPDNGTATITDAGENESGKVLKVTPEVIVKAIRSIIAHNTKVEVRKDIRHSIADAYREAYAGDIDGEAADVIVQVAIFGEIIYG